MPFFLPSGPQWASHHWMSSVLCLSEIPELMPVQFWCWLDLCSKRNASFQVPRPTTDPCRSGSRPAHSASSSASLPRSGSDWRTAGRQQDHQLKRNLLHSRADIALLLTSSAGVIFSSRRLSRFSMADMRLFSSFICQENRDTVIRRRWPAAAAMKCCLPPALQAGLDPGSPGTMFCCFYGDMAFAGSWGGTSGNHPRQRCRRTAAAPQKSWSLTASECEPCGHHRSHLTVRVDNNRWMYTGKQDTVRHRCNIVSMFLVFV